MKPGMSFGSAHSTKLVDLGILSKSFLGKLPGSLTLVVLLTEIFYFTALSSLGTSGIGVSVSLSIVASGAEGAVGFFGIVAGGGVLSFGAFVSGCLPLSFFFLGIISSVLVTIIGC